MDPKTQTGMCVCVFLVAQTRRQSRFSLRMGWGGVVDWCVVSDRSTCYYSYRSISFLFQYYYY